MKELVKVAADWEEEVVAVEVMGEAFEEQLQMVLQNDLAVFLAVAEVVVVAVLVFAIEALTS